MIKGCICDRRVKGKERTQKRGETSGFLEGVTAAMTIHTKWMCGEVSRRACRRKLLKRVGGPSGVKRKEASDCRGSVARKNGDVVQKAQVQSEFEAIASPGHP